jgi:hypothetical protein
VQRAGKNFKHFICLSTTHVVQGEVHNEDHSEGYHPCRRPLDKAIYSVIQGFLESMTKTPIDA